MAAYAGPKYKKGERVVLRRYGLPERPGITTGPTAYAATPVKFDDNPGEQWLVGNINLRLEAC